MTKDGWGHAGLQRMISNRRAKPLHQLMPVSIPLSSQYTVHFAIPLCTYLHTHTHPHTPAATVHPQGPPQGQEQAQSFFAQGWKSHGSDWLKSSTAEHTPKCVSEQVATVKNSHIHSLVHWESMPNLEWVKVYSLCIIRAQSTWKQPMDLLYLSRMHFSSRRDNV